MPVVEECCDVTPLCCHSTKDSVFRVVHLNNIWNAYFSLSLSCVWTRKSLIFLCGPAMTGMVQLQPHGRFWWNSHLSEAKAKVSVVPFMWTDLLGNLLPRWAKPSSGLPKHHPVLQGFTPFYEVFKLIEWHNTKPIMSSHQDFGQLLPPLKFLILICLYSLMRCNYSFSVVGRRLYICTAL